MILKRYFLIPALFYSWIKVIFLTSRYSLPDTLSILARNRFKRLTESEREWAFKITRHLCSLFRIRATCLICSLTLMALDKSPLTIKIGADARRALDVQAAHCWLESLEGQVITTDQNIPQHIAYSFQSHAS